MVSKAVLVLLHIAVLVLELDHLINEDLLVGKTEKELAIELELRGHV